jgi:hypothetical protein
MNQQLKFFLINGCDKSLFIFNLVNESIVSNVSVTLSASICLDSFIVRNFEKKKKRFRSFSKSFFVGKAHNFSNAKRQKRQWYKWRKVKEGRRVNVFESMHPRPHPPLTKIFFERQGVEKKTFNKLTVEGENVDSTYTCILNW